MQDLPPPDARIGALASRLIDDGKEFLQAEIALYRVQFSRWTGQAKFVAIYGIVALLLVNAAVIALFVGLLLSLQTIIGPGWATVAVVLGTLALAGLFGWLAYGRVRKLIAGEAAK